MSDLPPPPPPDEGPVSSPGGPGRPSGLPYPAFPPEDRTDLPEIGPGSPGVILPRFGARLIDWVLIALPLAIWARRYVEINADGDQVGEFPVWFIVIASVIPIVYEWSMLAWRGQTVGKLILKLQVVRYADGDMLIGYQAAIRTLIWTVPFFLLPLVLPPALASISSLIGIGILLSSVFDRTYRGIHDKAAATIVLRTAEVRSRFAPR